MIKQALISGLKELVHQNFKRKVQFVIDSNLVEELNKNCSNRSDYTEKYDGFQPWTVENILKGKKKCYNIKYTDSEICLTCEEAINSAYRQLVKRLFGLCDNCIETLKLDYFQYCDTFFDEETLMRRCEDIDLAKICSKCLE
jgi:hypothetical protein